LTGRRGSAALSFGMLVLLGVGCATQETPFTLPTGAVAVPRLPSPTETGPPTEELIEIPDIRYTKVALARISIEDLGLKLSITERKESMDWQPETILSQSPEVGALVEPGSKVKVTISVLPKCDPSYPDICLEPRGRDVDCEDISARKFKALPSDPYRLDKNGDGIGCGRGDK
jgi:hypothetical protein